MVTAVEKQGFYPSELFNVEVMARFMRAPDIYHAASDALAPPPENMNFESFLLQPHIFTVAAMYDNNICGYVYVMQRTSIGGELHCGFHTAARGKIAKTFIEYAIHRAYELGFLKLWAMIPTDNRPAILLAKALNFTPEGRITKAMMRKDGVRDVLILSLDRPPRSN